MLHFVIIIIFFFCIDVNDILFCFVIYPSIAVLNIHLKQCTRLLIGNENLKSESESVDTMTKLIPKPGTTLRWQKI